MKKRMPPAKRRYDKRHPVISFRVSEEEEGRLRNLLEKQKKSIGQFFREALEVEERNYEEASNRGYRKGLARARQRCAVIVNCAACRAPIAIEDEETKADLAETVERAEYCYLCEDCEPPDWAEGWRIKRFNRVT